MIPPVEVTPPPEALDPAPPLLAAPVPLLLDKERVVSPGAPCFGLRMKLHSLCTQVLSSPEELPTSRMDGMV